LLSNNHQSFEVWKAGAGFQISKLWESTGLCQKYGGIPPPKVVFALFQTDVQQALLRAAASQKRGPGPSATPCVTITPTVSPAQFLPCHYLLRLLGPMSLPPTPLGAPCHYLLRLSGPQCHYLVRLLGAPCHCLNDSRKVTTSDGFNTFSPSKHTNRDCCQL
jgi:hypothetical protein